MENSLGGQQLEEMQQWINLGFLRVVPDSGGGLFYLLYPNKPSSLCDLHRSS